MTIKEFSEKYNIPYRYAYEASYKVHADILPFARDIIRDYPEDELIDSLKELAERKMMKHKQVIDKWMKIISKLPSVKEDRK